VLVALVSKLLIIILQYLAGLLLSVEKVLQISLPKPSADLLESQALQSTKHSGSDYLSTSNKYPTRQWCTFVLVAERLVLPHQVVALRLHLLDVIVVLGEAVSSFDCMAAACFRDFTSCSSNVSA
jgi:hypothetical protein